MFEEVEFREGVGVVKARNPRLEAHKFMALLRLMGDSYRAEEIEGAVIVTPGAGIAPMRFEPN